MSKSLVTIIPLVLLSSFTSCTKSTEPIDQKPDLGKRDYIWTIDTLEYPGSMQTWMKSLWCSSAKDVYAVGHNDQNRGLMWHYDGARWTVVRLAAADGGYIPGAIDLNKIYGFAANDVWAVGENLHSNSTPPPSILDSSLIIHYNGVNWMECKVPPSRGLFSVWGKSTTDVWAGGWFGALYHFDGLQWSKVPFNNRFQIYSITGSESGDVFLGATALYMDDNVLDTVAWVVKKWVNNNWGFVDSSLTLNLAPPPFGGIDECVIENTLYSAGSGTSVFEWAGTGWANIYTASSTIYGVKGRKKNNVFAIGQGIVSHYNGNDWKQLDGFSPNVIYKDAWTIDGEVFIVGYDANRTYIYHGK